MWINGSKMKTFKYQQQQLVLVQVSTSQVQIRCIYTIFPIRLMIIYKKLEELVDKINLAIVILILVLIHFSKCLQLLLKTNSVIIKKKTLSSYSAYQSFYVSLFANLLPCNNIMLVIIYITATNVLDAINHLSNNMFKFKLKKYLD